MCYRPICFRFKKKRDFNFIFLKNIFMKNYLKIIKVISSSFLSIQKVILTIFNNQLYIQY